MEQPTATPTPPTDHLQRNPNTNRNRNRNRVQLRNPNSDFTASEVGPTDGTRTLDNSLNARSNDRPPPRNRGGDRDSRPKRASQPGGEHVQASGQGQRQIEGNREPRPSNRGRRRPAGQPRSAAVNGTVPSTSEPGPAPDPDSSQPPPPRTGRRRAKFNAGLTDPADAKSASDHTKKPEPKNHTAPPADDLTSILTHALRTPPYPDCPICFNSVHPGQPTWSCSPEVAADGHGGTTSAQCCWTTFHLKCIRSWAAKSVKDLEDAWRARGEDRQGEWRCPGCQAKREVVPTVYWCFCHRTSQPSPGRLATPHSCGLPCSRARSSGCGHPCPLQCHPGPCPPCAVTVSKACHCGREITSFRCSTLTSTSFASSALGSCGRTCGRQLSCGDPAHVCAASCHPGDCELCTVNEVVKCFCGKEEKEVPCGDGKDRSVFCSLVLDANSREEKWEGRFECDNTCNRPFDCFKHTCQKSCHPPSAVPPPCPFSPERVTHCPCGQTPLSSLPTPPRTSCTAPIPKCPSRCSRSRTSCEHTCEVNCHDGACPPCAVKVVKVCRCGGTTREVRCGETAPSGETEIMCDRPCQALRACGRHQCNRICCPLASFARKGKRRNAGDGLEGVDDGGLHECDLACGKMLSCGNHQCEARDHRGACGVCLRSTFEELFCPCGRTVLEPPIPCGTPINCAYPCARPPLPCGHPPVPHSCHESNIVAGSDGSTSEASESPCPPCPFLTSKRCACGKKMVDNVRCSQERVACGSVCGRLLGCGFHHCERLCHGDECGGCTSVCGKSRKSCLPAHHPCTQTCHAPASCPETEPCLALVTLTCPCGLIRSSVPCSSVRLSKDQMKSSGEYQQLKCAGECAIAKRNARLADALGISPEKRDAKVVVVYNDELVAFAKLGSNAKFVGLVEKTFSDFVASEKRTQVLPHMPPERRKFVHDLASLYRMDTQMVDQEPHRSVQLIRRIDTRIPSPLLSAFVSSSPGPSSNLGKLADLRVRTPLPAPTPITGGRWTSVVSRPVSATGSSGNANAGVRSGGTTPTPAIVKPGAGAWVAPSVRAQRAAASASASVIQPQPPEAAAASAEDVPDDWEDDV
ncbi:hypothetical protein BV22DRAFT_1195572 [Leucogyrophana mollusca]|uniref:Uncharacterized protein n=1 Tax=Leucogyrophana mollusca TaxID=85980 RepID=A0ACB8BGH2_9AGAM|nr:hypothetical protein BV22DRAFT_1195572 [Leucogyrophana mollusca]